MYNIWSQGNCEGHVDIIRMLGSIDFFLPYFPLEGSNIRELFTKRLVDQSAAVLGSDATNLTWSDDVTDLLMSKVWAGRLLPQKIVCSVLIICTAGQVVEVSPYICAIPANHRILDMQTMYGHASIMHLMSAAAAYASCPL